MNDDATSAEAAEMAAGPVAAAPAPAAAAAAPDHPAPAQPLDASLYDLLPGAAPAGEPLGDEILIKFELPIPRTEEEKANILPDDPRARTYAEREAVAREALDQSRDLRAYVSLAEAMAATRGPLGLHAALHLLEHVVMTHWDALEPERVGERVSAFTPLRQAQVTALLADAVIFDGGGFDRNITLRQIYLASGIAQRTRRRPPREGETVDSDERLKGLVAENKQDAVVEQARVALFESARILRDLQAHFAKSEDFARIRFVEGRVSIADDLENYARAVMQVEPSAPAGGAGPGTPDQPGAPGGGEPDRPVSGPADRAAARVLAKEVIAYFAVEGRASPVPLALIKLEKMAEANFGEWLEEIAEKGAANAAIKIEKLDHDAFAKATQPATPPPPPFDQEAVVEALQGLSMALDDLKQHPVHQHIEMEVHQIGAYLRRAQEAMTTPGKAAAPVPGGPATTIASRAMAKSALQQLSQFYRHSEPSSPMGISYQRLSELVDMEFVDILEEVAPEGKNAALRLVPKPPKK